MPKEVSKMWVDYRNAIYKKVLPLPHNQETQLSASFAAGAICIIEELVKIAASTKSAGEDAATYEQLRRDLYSFAKQIGKHERN